ncbi:hypothetical protein DNTS_024341, partial [Danionella cerebrum]
MEPWTERLSESGMDSVNEAHGVSDAVEGQNSCSVINKNSYSTGAGDSWECCLFIIVPERTNCFRAVQTPGLLITPKPTFITVIFPADAL